MAIDPANTDTVTIPQLDPLVLALETFLVGANADGKMGNFTSEQLANFISPYVSTIGGSEFIPVTTTVLPNPTTKPVAFTFVFGGATYTQTTGGSIIVAVGDMAQLGWDGTTWTNLSTITLPANPPTGLVASGNANAVAGGLVYTSVTNLQENIKIEIGDVVTFFEQGALTSFTVAPVLTTETVIFNKQFNNLTTNTIRIWATTAGVLTLGSYTISGGTAVRSSFLLYTLVAGLNTITTFQVGEGQYFGFSHNPSSALGRVGRKNQTSSYGYYSFPVNVGTGTALTTELHTQSFGLSIDVIAKTSIRGDIANALTASDLGKSSVNLVDPAKIVVGSLINSSGAIQVVAGWVYSELDVTSLAVGDSITYGNTSSIRTVMYAGWYTAANVLIGSVIIFNPNVGSNSSVKPATATKFLWDLKEPSDSTGVYANAMANTGVSLLPYQPYELLIYSIDGIGVYSASGGGGGSFDQSLNTTDNVEFNELDVNVLRAVAFDVTTVPIWNETGTAPIAVGFLYRFLSGSHYILKSRGV